MKNAKSLSCAACVALALPLFSGIARAEDPSGTDGTGYTPPESVDRVPQETTLRSLPHRHDGFYLRLATGFGPYNESIARPGETAHTTVSGMASTGDFAIGGSPRPGLILGGAIWTTSVLASDTRTDSGYPVPPSTSQSGSYSVLGPWMDYYFNPHGGLHMPAGIGFAVVRGIDPQGARVHSDDVAYGAGILAGLGYDWWVGDEWSVGITGRLTGIVGTSVDADGHRWVHLIGSSPSVLFAVTYN
jgi:hypothetical protein